MIIFTTPAIKRGPYGLTAQPLKRSTKDGFNDRYWFCVSAVCEIFGLPANITKVWFEFHDRAGVDRWPVEVKHVTANDDIIIDVDGRRYHASGYTVRWLTHRLQRTKCFVACYYEAEGEAPEDPTIPTFTRTMSKT